MSGVLGPVKKGSAEIQGEQKPMEGVAPAPRGTSGVTVSADPSAALDLLGGPHEVADAGTQTYRDAGGVCELFLQGRKCLQKTSNISLRCLHLFPFSLPAKSFSLLPRACVGAGSEGRDEDGSIAGLGRNALPAALAAADRFGAALNPEAITCISRVGFFFSFCGILRQLLFMEKKNLNPFYENCF